MANKLRVDYEALGTSSAKLIEQGEIFEDCINVMTSEVEALPDIWEADTCDRYVQQYFDSKETLVEVRNLIQDMADQMQKISDNFRDADVRMAEEM